MLIINPQKNAERLLYSSADLEVVYHPGDTDYLLITFSCLYDAPGRNNFWAKSFCKKNRISAIGFVANRDTWYPRVHVQASLPSVMPVIENYERRISYGFSMGGYAAIKYSKMLCAQATISLAPQYSINPEDLLGRDGRYSRFFQKNLHSDMAIGVDDISGNIYQFFDQKYPEDNLNSSLIADVSPYRVRCIAVNNVGHHVAQIFRDSEAVQSLIRGAFADDLPLLAALASRRRRASAARAHTLALKALPKHPNWARMIYERVSNRFNIDQKAYFHHRLSHIELGRGALDKAEAAATKAVELMPNKANYARQLAMILLQNGQPEHALACIESALSRDVADKTLNLTLALILSSLGRVDDASQILNAGIRLTSEDAWLVLDVSRALHKRNFLQSALVWAEHACALQPTNIFGLRWKARVLKELGRVNEARSALEMAYQVNSGAYEILQALCDLESACGSYGQAMKWAEKAVRVQPRNPFAHSSLAYLLFRLNRHNDAIAILRTALSLDERNYRFMLNMSRNFVQLGDLDQALAWARRASQECPGDVDVQKHLAGVLKMAQNKAKNKPGSPSANIA